MKRTLAVLLFALLAVALPCAAQDTGDSNAHSGLLTYRPPVPGLEGLVTSAHPLASAAGAAILREGGTVADAAVAVSATLTVVEPQSSGIAGNGYAMFFERATGQVHALSLHGAAPLAVKPEALDAGARSWGMQASTTPGVIGGLIELLDRYGKLSLAQVLQPAIRYARDGHPINRSLAESVQRMQGRLKQFPTTAAVFLPQGHVPETGELFRQPEYAATLQKLVDAERQALRAGKGRSAALRAAYDRFYRGDIARDIAGFFQKEGGLLSLADLAAYRPQWDTPLHVRYRGYDVYANADTTRGGIEVLMQLNLIEGFDLKASGFQTPATLHLVAESIKVAKSDIYRYVADPRFTKVPWEGLLSKDYAAQRRALIRPEAAMAYPQAGVPPQGEAPRQTAGNLVARLPERYRESRDTTSFSIVDAKGNALAMTPTVGGSFGAGVVAGHTGLLFNNGMRLGSTSPYADNVNALRPGQKPLLNNSPIIVLKEGRLVLALGTPGGEGIGQTEFQVLLNVLDFGLDIQRAIEAPRLLLDAEPNFYKPGAAIKVAVEGRVPVKSTAGLRALGHDVQVVDDWTPNVGGMQGITLDERFGTLHAGADPRRAGYAIGW
jgi:gamma-glutamyltranspeptidase/glutathione hydrolase